MKVTEHLANANGKTLFTIEILPPLKGENIKNLFKNIDPLMEFKPPFIDVTYHREEYVYKKKENGLLEKRSTRKRPGTVGICAAIQNHYKVDTVPHIICGGFSREETENALIYLDFLGIDNVLVLQGDGTALPLADATFDRLFCNGSLEHFPDIRRGIREIVRILKPGARAVIIVPNFYVKTEQPMEFAASYWNWKRLFTEAVNQADILLYSTEQTLRDFAERFTARDLEEIHNAIADLRVARNAEDKDVDQLNAATGRLQSIMHRFAELMYSAPDSGQFS